MALNTQITNAVAIAMCDAAVDALDGGASNAVIQIYADVQPTDADTAVGAQVLLATLACSDPAFGGAIDDTGKATATASAITDDTSADATDVATWFRASTTTDGSTPVTTIMDGSVGTSSADMIINTVNIESGATVSVTAWTVSQPES